MADKIIRDPVHDVIAFQLVRPADDLLFRLLNSADVQRLRRIRQLGMAHLAYPGADHSRYSHSLGTMQTARRMIERLGREVALDEQATLACLVAALLHDVGHGPLSHVFEQVTGIDHEQTALRIVQDDQSEIHQILSDRDRSLPQQLAAFMQAQPPRSVLHDLISSQLDADRLDYLLRDDLMTGSRYGSYDLEWLLQALVAAGDRLAVTWKGLSAVEAYLQARYHMYRNVYFHKVVRSSEGMVRLALRRAMWLADQGRLEFDPPLAGLRKALAGERLGMAELLELDDVSVWQALKLWAASDDPALARLCDGLLYRRLYKTVDISHVPADEAPAVLERARAAVRSAGGDAEYDMFCDEPADTPYESFRPADCAGAGQILVREEAGRLTPLGELSPLAAALGPQLMFRRIHVCQDHAAVVRRAVGGDSQPPARRN